MRKRCHRRAVVPLPPRGLRPKLSRAQILDLAIVHHENLDVIARGQADESTLWQWIGGVLTWSRVAQVLDRGVVEMAFQLELAKRMVDRYRRTGRVLFDGLDYQQAKVGVDVMDQLAELVDLVTASAAAEWSENETNRMSVECDAQRAQSATSAERIACH